MSSCFVALSCVLRRPRRHAIPEPVGIIKPDEREPDRHDDEGCQHLYSYMSNTQEPVYGRERRAENSSGLRTGIIVLGFAEFATAAPSGRSQVWAKVDHA